MAAAALVDWQWESVPHPALKHTQGSSHEAAGARAQLLPETECTLPLPHTLAHFMCAGQRPKWPSLLQWQVSHVLAKRRGLNHLDLGPELGPCNLHRHAALASAARSTEA